MLEGVLFPQDVNHACELLKYAIEGNPQNYNAHNNIGTCYGVWIKPLDIEKAIMHHKLAAEQGIAGAMSNLGGHLFKLGWQLQDVEKQLEGIMWLEIAKSKGVEGAKKNHQILSKYVPLIMLEEGKKLAEKCIKLSYKKCGF